MPRPAYALVLIAILIALVFTLGGRQLSARGEQQAEVPKELLKQQIEAAKRVYTDRQKLVRAGEIQLDERQFFWSERLLEAELALTDKQAERIALATAHLQRVKELETLATDLTNAGRANALFAHVAKYFRVEAEITLFQEKAE